MGGGIYGEYHGIMLYKPSPRSPPIMPHIYVNYPKVNVNTICIVYYSIVSIVTIVDIGSTIIIIVIHPPLPPAAHLL